MQGLPSTLGRYQLLDRLGAGGMADVYRAYDPQLDRYVAIKVVVPEIAPADPTAAAFTREARSLAAFSHPNIVQIYDIGATQGFIYLVMEYVPGGSLAHRLEHPLPAADAVRLLLPIADALRYAHQHGVIHRDIKPANILIRDGRLLLSDFGISQVFAGGDTLTKAALGYGTPAYMSPEQLQGWEADPRSDLYSFAVVLFELVAGIPPFRGDNPLGVAVQHLRQPPPRLSDLAPNVPAELEAVLDRALAKDPSERYPDMAALIADLQPIAAGAGAHMPEDWMARPPAAKSYVQSGVPRPTAVYPPSAWAESRPLPGGAPVRLRTGWTPMLATALVGAAILVLLAGALFLWTVLKGGLPAVGIASLTQSPSAPPASSAPVTTTTAVLVTVPTHLPTLTPDSGTAPLPGGRDTPLETQVEQFMYEYYAAVSRRDYNASWRMLSDNFKATGANRDDFDLYVEWWNSFDSVEPLSVQAEVVDAGRRIVNATVRVRYHSSTRGVIEEQYTYRVVYNPEIASWQIDR